MRVQPRSNFECPTNDSNSVPFDEMLFIRLSSWQKSDRDTTLLGGDAFAGRIFHRYYLPFVKAVTLDFFSRGAKISPQTAHAFRKILSYCHFVSIEELKQIGEVLADQMEGVKFSDIETAAVGEVNGRLVLAIRWKAFTRKQVSLYMDASGDGHTVREMQFSAPAEVFDSYQPVLNDTMKSIQWSYEAPPVCVAS